MYYILRFLQHACSVIKFVILTIVCRSKSAAELMLHCYVYLTLNKSSMSMSIKVKLVFRFPFAGHGFRQGPVFRRYVMKKKLELSFIFDQMR